MQPGTATALSSLPPRQSIIALLLALILVVLPLAFELPLWVVGSFGLCVGWSVRCLRSHRAMPSFGVRALLVFAAVGLVLAVYGTILGRNAGVSLFVLLTGLKLLELRSYRDAMVLLYLGYFLVVANVLFSQSMLMAAYVLVAAVLLLTVQLAMHRTDQQGTQQSMQWRGLVRDAGGMLAQAVPLVLVLFVLFPRLEGPLWGLPTDAYSGMTGLGDSMSPGNISSLALSDEVAFRVRFEGAVPESSQLYWRGPVLGGFDGRNWSLQPGRRARAPELVEASRPVSYTINLEPHNRHWLLALETVSDSPEIGHLTADRQLVANRPVRDREQYRVTSWLQTSEFGLDPDDRSRMLLLPGDANPRTRALAAEWGALPPRKRVQRALELIADQPFVYTLQPPLLGDKDNMDQFLFETRRGFCEHYSGAFTFLMRAAGVPARVVTGYQGGELNPVDDYLLVRQRNAHAWSEVWLDGRGWTRVDPTSVIPASRVELPQENLLSRPGLSLGLEAPGFLTSGLRSLYRTMDALNNRWNEWVLAYGGEQQRNFLRSLGLGDLSATGIGLALVGSALGLILLVAAWMFWRYRPRDPVLAAYARYCRQLARHGLVRGDAEGPWDFYRRVARQRPLAADQARLITSLYASLRYHRSGDPRRLKQLQRVVSHFHP